MGLYGVDAAMPPHLIDDIALRREGHEPVMAFLDQFNHRLNTLLYRTWKKYRYPTGFRPGGTDERSRDLLALAGFDCGRKAERAGWPDSRVLALLGLLNQRTRTAEGLAGVVALVAPGIDVGVEQCHPTWVVVSDQVRLGTGAGQTGSLGGDGRGYGLGRRILCRTKAVRVTLRPVGANQVNELLPGALLYRDLMAALRIYVGIKVDVLLRMEISAAVAPVLALGETRARLAWTSLLKPASDRVMSIPLGRYQAFPDSLSHAAAGVDAGGAA
jgi:type VI secretion system protein ImpH